MSDALEGRAGLPEAHRWLLETYPRLHWREAELGEVARFWLQMHGSFRHKQTEMARQVAAWRAGGDLVSLHRGLIPTLQAFLQHLDGHHRVESGHYFPVMRRVEPRIMAGIDLLDADHDVLHDHLDMLFKAGLAFHQTLASGDPDAGDRAAQLADVLERVTVATSRHLEDEEDIVIPLIQRHADAFAP
ncbi:MAG: hemerythrin domain-containing protein [Caulobacteraceae bacterium]|nr:hemerythrin domain-containing protein [Caulobacteraceae bacterium]